MQTSQPLCRGSAWIMENFLSRCIMKSTGPICMDIRKSLRLMLFLLAPLQGCALDRLCEYDLQYEAAALKISENVNAGPLWGCDWIERRIGCRSQVSWNKFSPPEVLHNPAILIQNRRKKITLFMLCDWIHDDVNRWRDCASLKKFRREKTLLFEHFHYFSVDGLREFSLDFF